MTQKPTYEELQAMVRKLRNAEAEHKAVVEALRESEARFRLLYEKAPLAYQSLDVNGHCIAINQAWLDTLGYSRQEVIGKPFADFLHPDWRDHFKENFPRFKAVGEILGVEFEMVKKDGSGILVSFSGKIGQDKYGNFQQTHCIFHDITDRKRAEEEKARLEEKLRQAYKMEAIGTLAGGIAHDFNNILTSIIGFTELAITDAEKDTPLSDSLREVLIAGMRAKDLVKQILAFARQSEEKLEPIQVRPIAQEALKFIRSSLPATIDIRTDLQSDSVIKANPTQIYQVFINLCTNAAHAMEENGGILTVGLQDIQIEKHATPPVKDLKPGGYLKMAVSDTGVGVAPEIIDSIFEPYFTTKAVGKGTGMGLAVVQGIVDSCGGKITVESDLGHGSTFTIYLPLAGKQDGWQLPSESELLPTGSESILFVDDEEQLANMVERILSHLGYRVSIRTSSLEALVLFKQKPSEFDLIITDMTMPNMTGDKLAKELMRIRPDIPIILCTGYSNKISEKSALEMGIKAFAFKPIIMAEIANTVRKILDDAKNLSQV